MLGGSPQMYDIWNNNKKKNMRTGINHLDLVRFVFFLSNSIRTLGLVFFCLGELFVFIAKKENWRNL